MSEYQLQELSATMNSVVLAVVLQYDLWIFASGYSQIATWFSKFNFKNLVNENIGLLLSKAHAKVIHQLPGNVDEAVWLSPMTENDRSEKLSAINRMGASVTSHEIEFELKESELLQELAMNSAMLRRWSDCPVPYVNLLNSNEEGAE